MLRAFTFGQCVFETPQARIAPESEILFALLLSVAASPPDGISRDELVLRLWPRADDEERRHRLRQALYRLRQLQVPVHLRAGFVALEWERTELDVHLLLHGALDHKELVRLGRLPFLPAYAPELAGKSTRWIEDIRGQVALRLRRALSDEVRSARDRGRFHEMGQAARALLILDPLNEVATFGLAESLALEGSKVEALRLLEDYEREVGSVSKDLQLPARVLRRRVAEVLDDFMAPRSAEAPFVGREPDFAMLRQVLRDTRRGMSHLALVTGHAGVGKSRIVGEVLRLAMLDGSTIASYSPSTGDSFTPVSTLLTLTDLLLTLPGALGCAQEHLQHLRGLSSPDTAIHWSGAGIAADILYAQLVTALAELVMAIAEDAPLVISVDDADRLHPVAWRVLLDVWERARSHSFCLLFVARTLPSAFSSASAASCTRRPHHIQIEAFSLDESYEFVRRWAASARVEFHEDLVTTMVSQSRGNPFFLGELLSDVSRGHDANQTPPSVANLIQSQLIALSQDALRSLLAISVLDKHATTSRVSGLLELRTLDLMKALEELSTCGLVEVRGANISCRHRIIAEQTIARSLPTVLAIAHSRAAALLEGEAEQTASTALLGDCVTHWINAGENARAYDAALRLGRCLLGMGLGEEAEDAFRRAEQLTDDAHEKLRAAEGRLIALRLAARWHAIAECHSSLIELRRRLFLDEPPRDELYLIALEGSIWSHSPSADLDALIDLAEDLNTSPSTRTSAALLAAMYADNRYDQDTIRRAYNAVTTLADPSEADCSWATLRVVYHASVGDKAETKEATDRLQRLASTSGLAWVRIQGLRRAAIGLTRQGHPHKASLILEDVLTLTEKWRLSHQCYATRELLVDAYLATDEISKAEQHVDLMRSSGLAHSTRYLSLMLRSAEVRLAWASGKGAGIDHIRPGSFIAEEVDIPFLRHHLISNEVASALLRGEDRIAEESIDELLLLHLAGRSMGRQDYLASVLFAALRSLGRNRVAARLEREYHEHHRRENGIQSRVRRNRSPHRLK